jgi:mannose-6-phosphate isomerase-like protein (cupin superfamily)
MKDREERPWGWFETIEETSSYKLKKIFVKPNQQFSLQYHEHRDEHWIIVEGSGVITLGDEKSLVKENDSFFVEKKLVHRMRSGNNGILFYEVQTGVCDEEDIVRLEDDYGRSK